MSEPSVLLVFSNPSPGLEDEYNDWYESVHLADVLSVPGVAAAQRYRLTSAGDAAAEPAQRYLAVYELDGDPEEVMAEFGARAGDGRMVLSKSLDLRNISLHAWTPCGERQTATVPSS